MLYTLGCVCNQNSRDLSRHDRPLDVVADRSCRLSGSLEYGAWGDGSPPPGVLQSGKLWAVEVGERRGRGGAWARRVVGVFSSV